VQGIDLWFLVCSLWLNQRPATRDHIIIEIATVIIWRGYGMNKNHSHHFVERYTGLVGFGFDRETDENTVRYYLQKFSDDTLTENLLKRLTDDELSEIFFMITKILKNHLSEPEYHSLFLKDN